MRCKVCTNCGAENDATSSLCSTCGFVLPDAVKSSKTKKIDIETEIQSNSSYHNIKKNDQIIAEYRPNPIIYSHLLKQGIITAAISTPISIALPLLSDEFTGLSDPFVLGVIIILIIYLATLPLTYIRLKKYLWRLFAARYLITQNNVIVFVFRKGRLVDYATPINEISGVLITQKNLIKFGLANATIQMKLFARKPRKERKESIPIIEEALTDEPENNGIARKKLKVKSGGKRLRVLGRQLKYLNLKDAQDAKKLIESLILKTENRPKV